VDIIYNFLNKKIVFIFSFLISQLNLFNDPQNGIAPVGPSNGKLVELLFLTDCPTDRSWIALAFSQHNHTCEFGVTEFSEFLLVWNG